MSATHAAAARLYCPDAHAARADWLLARPLRTHNHLMPAGRSRRRTNCLTTLGRPLRRRHVPGPFRPARLPAPPALETFYRRATRPVPALPYFFTTMPLRHPQRLPHYPFFGPHGARAPRAPTRRPSELCAVLRTRNPAGVRSAAACMPGLTGAPRHLLRCCRPLAHQGPWDSERERRASSGTHIMANCHHNTRSPPAPCLRDPALCFFRPDSWPDHAPAADRLHAP